MSDKEKIQIRIHLEDIDKLVVEDGMESAQLLAAGWLSLLENTNVGVTLPKYMEVMKLELKKIANGKEVKLQEEGGRIAASDLEIESEIEETEDGRILVKPGYRWYGLK